MENNQRNSKKRLNSLILLVAFTAIMLIVSTYAWFSSQKNVTIGNLQGTVNVAEGLMVSLDAQNWTQEIDLQTPNLDQTIDDATGNLKYSLAKPYDGGSNNVPTEMLPVSATGVEDLNVYDTDGSLTTAGNSEMTFYTGVNVNGDDLHTITAVDTTSTQATDPDYPGYYAIDVFLQNSSKINVIDENGDGTPDEGSEVQGESRETLQLNTNSLLQLLTTGNAELTGLQNTVRAALAMYEPVDGASLTTADSVTASAYVTATQSQILAAYSGATIRDIAIWEPNAADHVDYIVTNNNNITWNTAVRGLYIADATDGKFTATEMLPTYALTETSLDAEETVTSGTTTYPTPSIAGIYDWNDGTTTEVTTIAASGLERQIALQTKKSASDYTIFDGGIRNLVSVTSSGASVYELGDPDEEDGVVTFDMLKNTVVKCRLYVWLEGQDVDCINYASHGGGIKLDLGLVKGANPGGYAS